MNADGVREAEKKFGGRGMEQKFGVGFESGPRLRAPASLFVPLRRPAENSDGLHAGSHAATPNVATHENSKLEDDGGARCRSDIWRAAAEGRRRRAASDRAREAGYTRGRRRRGRHNQRL